MLTSDKEKDISREEFHKKLIELIPESPKEKDGKWGQAVADAINKGVDKSK